MGAWVRRGPDPKHWKKRTGGKCMKIPRIFGTKIAKIAKMTKIA